MRRKLREFVGKTALCALVVGAGVVASSTSASTVNELARIKGHDESVLQGLGLVLGLPGTGDSGEELAIARPLMALLQNNGNPIANIDELANTKSVALVMVTCRVPENGGLKGDGLDVTVATVHGAKSLAGGELYLTPMTGPYVGSQVYAVAAGPLIIEDELSPTRARVAGGAQLVQDVLPAAIGSSFSLIVDEARAGFGSTSELASAINSEYFNTPGGVGQRIATPINHREVLIEIPDVERANPTPFVAAVMATDINTALLRLPAQVFVNRQSGIINFTGDVEISPGVVTVRGLTVTTTVPEPVPTPDAPVVESGRWIAIGTDVSGKKNARLRDLLTAFNRLDVPVEQQIDIIRALHRNGQLHAKLVID